MARPLIEDELWAVIEPLLPAPKPRRRDHPGRKPADPRRCLTGIVFVLKTGIQWEDLPVEMGVCGMTCWRRLRDWQAAGVWDRLHAELLARLRGADRINWARAVVDSSSVRAVHAGEQTGPSPVDRRKRGSKHHVITDGQGVPLAEHVTVANRHDTTQLHRLVRAVPPVRVDARAGVRRLCWLIEATTPSGTGAGCVHVASARVSPDAVRHTVRVWESNVGW